MALGETYVVDGSGNVHMRHGYNRGWRATWKCIVPGNFGGDAHTDYLFYDPVEGTGEFYTMYVNGTLSLIKGHRGGWRQTWHTIVPGDFGGGAHTDLLFYDREDGTVALYATDGQGGMSLLNAYHGTWGKSWDMVIPGDFGGGGAHTDLLFYDRTAGRGTFYRVDDQGKLTPFREYASGWRKTWDIIVAGRFGSGPNMGLLFYDRKNKTGEFYATTGQGILSLLRSYAGTWRETWDLIVPLLLPNNHACSLLFYDAGIGTGEFYGVDDKGNIQLLKGFEKAWRTSWTAIVPCRFNEPAFSYAGLLLYSPVGFTVPADPGVVQTGIRLKRGDVVSLRANGRMTAAGNHGPGGAHELAGVSWPEPGLRRFCLYARYGRGYVAPIPHSEQVTTASLLFTALTDGALELCVNDEAPQGRSGRLEVDVRVQGGDPPAVQPYTFYIAADAGRSGTGGGERVWRGLNAGDVVVVEAFGRMNSGAVLAADSGPAGEHNAGAPAHFPAPGLPPCALYVEVGQYDRVTRRLALQGHKDAPYGAVRFVAQDGERWARVRLNDAPLADNSGGFHVYLWVNAQGKHLGQYGVHVAQPIPLKEDTYGIGDYRETGRAFPRGMHSISPYAIRQAGGIGNCWQVAALASLAHAHPQMIREMIDDHQDGTYTVRIYDNLGGKRVSLLLDSNLPNCIASGLERDGSLYTLWPALLQKAHFFVNGFNYEPIDVGNVSWVPWDDLTNVKTDWTIFGAMELRDWLKKGVGQGRPLVASTFDVWVWAGLAPRVRVWNIIRDHVYSFLDYRQTGGPDGDWEVYIMNPHRRNEYKPGQAKDDTSTDGDGFFWMPMSKMKDAFGSLYSVDLPDAPPRAELYRLDDNGQLEHVWSANWRSWDVIVPVRWGSKVGFLYHRYQDREAWLDELDPGTGKLTKVWSRNWGRCWQIIVPVAFGTSTGILSFARNRREKEEKDPVKREKKGTHEGIDCLERFEADGSLTQVWRIESKLPWDVVIPFSHSGKNGVIKHQFRGGDGYAAFEIDTLDAAGKLNVESSLTSTEPAWNVMVPLRFGGQAGVLSHAFGDQGAALHMLDDSMQINDNSMHFATWWRARWAHQWDMIVPVVWGAGHQGVLSYDLDTATLCLDRLGSDRKLTEQWRLTHLPRPNLLVPLQADGKTWILMHSW